MAEKSKGKAKEATPAPAEEVTAVPEPVQEPLSYDAMEEYVEIELFYDGEKYKDPVYVSVNGENCMIQRGQPVRIKRKFAEVVKAGEAQDNKTKAIIRELTERSNAPDLN